MHARIADGLMSLRQLTRRTLTLVACLPNSWTIIRSRTVDPVSDRFRMAPRLTTIHDAALAQQIVERGSPPGSPRSASHPRIRRGRCGPTPSRRPSR